mmetsp:Transcript_15214/g.14789  ORF Transcript_15214/g.14789 Transcript_15214/m.14789 type:complete len:249 (-) Transcript_15214:864-1610(-)
MLHNEGTSLRINDPPFHDFGATNSLLRVQVGARLIDQVDITGFPEGQHNGHTLELSSRQLLDLVVQQGLNVQRNQHFRLKQRSFPRLLQFRVEKVLNTTNKLWSDFLRLVADIQLGHDNVCIIGLQKASKDFDESGFASTILAKHHNDLGLSELPAFHVEFEVIEGLGHGRVLVVDDLDHLLRLFFGDGGLGLFILLHHLEGELLLSEPQVLSGDEPLQEDIDSFSHRKRHGNHPIGPWSPIQHTDKV